MRSEWSLIFFTLLTQIAVGSYIVLAGLNVFAINIGESILSRELTLTVLYLILSFSMIALVSSFLHLGKPRNAVYSLTNINSSWLSREILFFGLFVGVASLYTFFEYNLLDSSELKNILMGLGILLGIVAVFSMARLYMLETVHAWNSFNTFVQFYSTTFILGIISVCLTIYILNSNILYRLISYGIYRIFLVLFLISITISMVSFLYELWSLSKGGQAEVESLAQIIYQNRVQFYSRIILSVFSILILLYQIFLSENTYNSYSLILLTILMLISELIGRYLFYVSYNRVGI